MRIVSGGSTPSLFHSHELPGSTRSAPARTFTTTGTPWRAELARRAECAAAMLVTVVSTARPGQIIVDGGSKTFSSDRLSGPHRIHFRPRDGSSRSPLPQDERRARLHRRAKRAVARLRWGNGCNYPNHICVAVNLHERVYGIRNGEVEEVWEVAGRGKLQ